VQRVDDPRLLDLRQPLPPIAVDGANRGQAGRAPRRRATARRVGRVDRLGGRIHKLRDKDAKLEIPYPSISQTIDDRIYETVRQREKWLEFLLGAPPDVQDYAGGETTAELPAAVADRLRIDLRPPLATAAEP
jgi:hypothetical protein